MAQGFLLGLDWGGGGVRALALDVESGATTVRRRAIGPVLIPGTAGFGYTLDLAAGFAALCEATREALAAAGAAPDRVLGVAATSIRFAHVVVAEDGAPIDVASNRDARAAVDAMRLAASHGAELAAETGHWPHPILAAVRLAWLREREPSLAARGARYLSLGDWLGYRLSGEAAADRSQASHSGLFDVAKGDWHAAWIDRLALPRGLFPEVRLAGERLGALRAEAAEALGLSKGTPVALGGSDGACALLGAGALTPGARVAVTGTTAPVLAVTATPAASPELWTEAHAVAGRWMVDSNAGAAGDLLDWLGSWLEPGEGGGAVRLLARAALAERGAAGMFSSFGGRRFDARNLPLPIGSLWASPLVQSPGDAARADAARAAALGVAFALRENLAQLAERVAASGPVTATGGLTRSAAWCQLVADATATPIGVTVTADATALGAALCAGAGAGLFPDAAAAAAALVPPPRRFAPDPAHAAAYADRFAEWTELRAARAPADAAAERLAMGQLVRRAAAVPKAAEPARRLRILATADLDASALAALGALGDVEHASFRSRGRLLSGPDLARALAGFDVFVTEVDLVDAAVLAACPELRVVASCRGDAVNVDVAAATAHGVPVLNAPGRNAEAVADLTVAFLLALARKLPGASAFLRSPDVAAGDMGRMGQAFTRFQGRELGRGTVGLVGFGAVGRAVARRLRGFGTRILVHDPLVGEDAIAVTGAEPVTLPELLAESDFVSLHAPVSDATRGLLGAAELARMKRGAGLVNTARAALVDEEALAAALASGALGGAALDVFSVEPPGADHPLLGLENVIATPHIGGNTVDVAAHQGRIVADDLARLLRGEAPRHALNAEAAARFSFAEPRPAVDAATLARLAARPAPSVSDLQRDRAPAKPRAAAPAPPTAAEAKVRAGTPLLRAETRERMAAIAAAFVARALASPELRSAAQEREVTLHFRLPDAGTELHLRLAGGAVSGAVGAPEGSADVELRLAADVFDGMFTGRVNAMQAAMDGKLSFTGDTGKAMTLQILQRDLAECYRAARAEVGDPGDLTAIEGAGPAAAAAVAADDPRVTLIQVVNELYAQSLITATGGNVSVRVPGRDELWITPSQLFKGDLRPELMTRIDLAGRPLDEDARAPSSERLIHCAIYRARPETGAVIHAHAPHATILANTDLPFLPISTEAAFFGNIPRVPFIMPGTEGLAKAVGEAAQNDWAVLLKNHGLIVAGRSLRRAADSVEIIERTAEVILGCYAVGREPPVLPEDAVRTLRKMGDLVA
jgi:phosphoglycerate dehydrogenase-like enzyme/sugar (pentulose or hexulose) kinase/ribulose-5-phosphate 4-epimerase/fuculose-1-phosphate aldolase/putative sterol carrier protein